MRGLIHKDLLNLRDTAKMYVAIMLILVTYCIVRGREVFIPIIATLVLSTVTSATFTKDSISHWNKLAVTMPFHRKTIVKSKFLLSFIILMMGFALGTMAIVTCAVASRMTYQIGFQVLIFGTCIAVCANMIMHSVLFRGAEYIEKMELLTVISYLLAAAITLGMTYAIGLLISNRLLSLLISLVLLLMAMIMALCSCIRVFEKKDIK